MITCERRFDPTMMISALRPSIFGFDVFGAAFHVCTVTLKRDENRIP